MNDSSHWKLWWVALLSAVFPVWLLAQPLPPTILRESIQSSAGKGFVFEFTANSDDPKAHRVQVAAGWQTPMVWSLDSTATVNESALGRFQVLIPSPAATTPLFYRILTEGSVAGLLQITEVMSDNSAVFPDASGAFWDWIEVSNPQDRALALVGFALSDDPLKPGRWRFPDRWIQPGQSLVVYASGLDRIGPSNELHTDFRLDAAGETVTLSDPI